jgi:hypothetical protein
MQMLLLPMPNAVVDAAVQMPLLLKLNDTAAQVQQLLTLNCCRGAAAAVGFGRGCHDCADAAGKCNCAAMATAG